MTQQFATRLIAWQKRHGRHHLPWQARHDAYSVWVAETMLQQTQVATVTDFYPRFMARFPNLDQLARASLNEVLELWSGLGYYARARNLHRAAQLIMNTHGGVFPEAINAIQALPGIGRSTAAAIAVFAFSDRQAILDGNVKRIFARYFGVSGWPGEAKVQTQLWQLATQQLPDNDLPAYTQGLMDLGTSLCRRRAPLCGQCPVADDCYAYRTAKVSQLPSPKPQRPRPLKRVFMLMLWHEEQILLVQRPNAGIWGGLWSFIEVVHQADISAILTQLGLVVKRRRRLAPLHHDFTHFQLDIRPQWIEVFDKREVINGVWLRHEAALVAAVPSPVRKLLQMVLQ